MEDEVSEEEDEESGGACKSPRHKGHSPDSGLKPSARLNLYDNHGWRLDVSTTGINSVSGTANSDHIKELCLTTSEGMFICTQGSQ